MKQIIKLNIEESIDELEYLCDDFINLRRKFGDAIDASYLREAINEAYKNEDDEIYYDLNYIQDKLDTIYLNINWELDSLLEYIKKLKKLIEEHKEK